MNNEPKEPSHAICRECGQRLIKVPTAVKEPGQSARDEAHKMLLRPIWPNAQECIHCKKLHLESQEFVHNTGCVYYAVATALAAKEEERQKDQAECLRLAERVGVAEQERDKLKHQLEQAVGLAEPFANYSQAFSENYKDNDRLVRSYSSKTGAVEILTMGDCRKLEQWLSSPSIAPIRERIKTRKD